MPDTLDIAQYELPAGALDHAVAIDGTVGAGLTLIAPLRSRQEKRREELEKWRARFDRLYDEAVRRDFDPPLLMRWADALAEKERAAKEQLHPVIETLQRKIAEHGDRVDTEALDLIQGSIDAACAWITPYQMLRAKLLKLVAARRGAAGGTLRARPVSGDIDYAALSHEITARFPKILAALAK